MKLTIPFLFDYVFPNMTLPNALLPEYAMVNFLTSRHNTSEVNMLEQHHSVTDNTLGGTLFNNQFGQLPNSNSNLHHLRPCYYDYVDVVQNSVFMGRQSGYVYPIACTPHLEFFFGISRASEKVNGSYFWKNISSVVLEDVRRGKAVILIDYAEENFLSKNEYEQLHECLKHSNIPKERVIFAFNTFNGEEVYNSWFTPEEQRVTVKNWPFVIMNTSHHYHYNPSQYVPLEWFKESRNTIRKNHFLFKVRRPREHRLAMLSKLASDNHLHKGDWSCLTPVTIEYQFQHLEREYGITITPETIRELDKQIPHTLESESTSEYHNVSAWTDQHPEAYKNSYLYICTETYMHSPHKSLTEKVFKPIINLQPFVFIAYQGALQQLRDLGFKTFSPYIDESYDNIEDKGERFRTAYEEIDRLLSMPIEELHDLYWKMEEILIYNQEHLLNIHRNEELATGFFKFLHSQIPH